MNVPPTPLFQANELRIVWWLSGSNSVVTDDRKLGMWSLLRMWWSTKSIVAMDLLMHNRVVAGLHLGLLLEQQPARVRAAMDHVLQLYAEGKVKPKIDSIWPLDKVRVWIYHVILF